MEPNPIIHRGVTDAGANAGSDNGPHTCGSGRNDDVSDPDLQLVGGSECSDVFPQRG